MKPRYHSLLIGTATAVVAAVALTALVHCGRGRGRREFGGCEGREEREMIRLVVGEETQLLSPPCTRLSNVYISGPVQLTALAEGLHVVFRVNDDSYAPGAYREPRCERYEQTDAGRPQHCQRDAVVVFPTSSLPGAAAIELITTPRPDGYQVDHILPWSTWNVDRGLNRFRLLITVFDRGPSGAETELRVSTMLEIGQPIERTTADAGTL